jgi:predicted DCC family thiol-disulfide oxidoreductase YuxK
MLIIYDGACPFCSTYTRHLQLQQSIGTIELLNARTDDPRIAHYRLAGYDFDEGMLVILQDQIYAGADAVHVLALHTAGNNFFNRLHALIFSSVRFARLIYPLLKFGRRITLLIRGISLLKNS